MRVGLVIPIDPVEAWPDGPDPVCREAEELGLDLVLLQGDRTGGQSAAALTAAAFLAARTTTIRIAALAPVGPNPVLIAEQAAVADNAANGRVHLVIDGAGAPQSMLAETVEVVLSATGPRPFRYLGEHWTIPAEASPESELAVTPKPAQLELPIWLIGANAADTARRFGLSHVAAAETSTDAAADDWNQTAAALGPGVRRLRRPAIRRLECDREGRFDAIALLRRLRSEAGAWGLDTVLIRLPEALTADARRDAVRRLASRVRPQLQVQAIPERLQAEWDRRL